MGAWQAGNQLDVQRAKLPFTFLPEFTESPALGGVCFFILFVQRRR